MQTLMQSDSMPSAVPKESNPTMAKLLPVSVFLRFIGRWTSGTPSQMSEMVNLVKSTYYTRRRHSFVDQDQVSTGCGDTSSRQVR